MADKKITALTDLGSSLAAVDLFHVVDDPSVTPINKKISAANVFNNIPSFLGLKQTAQTINIKMGFLLTKKKSRACFSNYLQDY